MKKLIVIFMAFILAFMMLAPHDADAAAQIYVEINNRNVTVILGATLVISGVVIFVNHGMGGHSWNIKGSDKNRSLSFKEQYLTEVQNMSRPDGKVTLFKW
jgi:hypothetical protein